jgi:hypothetical protein
VEYSRVMCQCTTLSKYLVIHCTYSDIVSRQLLTLNGIYLNSIVFLYSNQIRTKDRSQGCRCHLVYIRFQRQFAQEDEECGQDVLRFFWQFFQ